MTSCDDTYSDKDFSDDSGWLDEVAESHKSASKALQAYIEQFENETTPKPTRYGCYGGSVSSLLSSKPKSASSPATLKRSPKTSEDMVDDLISWINASYAKDLHRKIVPYGSRSTSSIHKLHLSELEETDGKDCDKRSVWSDPEVELSTLPSPGSSMASDIGSNADSVSTDMLLQSFNQKGNSKLRKASVHRNYPSWVEDLTTQNDYPSWVDDIDKTQFTNSGSLNITKQNQRNGTSFPNKTTPRPSVLTKSHLSKSLSPSFFRHYSEPYGSHQSFMSTSLQDHRRVKATKHQTRKGEAWDLESTDTEVLISQPMYGHQPVNMGGSLHSSLYRDRKIRQLQEESMRKIVKRSHSSPTKEKSSSNSRTLNTTRKRESSSAKVNYGPVITTSPLKNTWPLSKMQQTINKQGAFLSSGARQKPFKESKNLKHLWEERKDSLDSHNTDQLMKQSPTGIHMVKRNHSKQSRTQGTPSTSAKNTINKTPRVSQTSRRNTSEHLTKLVVSGGKSSGKYEIQAKERHSKERYPREAPVIPNTTAGRFLKRTNKGNDPRQLGSSVRNTPKSALRLPTTSIQNKKRLKQTSLTEGKQLHAHSVTDQNGVYSRRPPVDYSTNRVDLMKRTYEETDSMNTEALVIHPPMPLFDASPSLTSQTISSIDSDGSANSFWEQQALKTSLLVEDDRVASSSGTSYMDFVRSPDQTMPVTDIKAELRGSSERHYPFNSEQRVSSKPGIITSFLEDCMRSSQESRLEEDARLSIPSEELCDDGSERPVETLKKMLFTVQGLASQDEDEKGSDREIMSENGETVSDTVAEEMFSDIMSSEIPNGDNSLSRAYYHLARLKKLVSMSEKVAGLR